MVQDRGRPVLLPSAAWRIGFPCLVLALTAIVSIRSDFHAPHGSWVAGFDPVHYYMYARSLFFDGDVDFTNEVARLYPAGPPFAKTARGIPPNVWSIGPAILWMPFFAIGHAVTLAADNPSIAADGYSFYYQSAVYVGNSIYVLAGVWFLYLLLNRMADWADRIAFAAVVLGTQIPDLLFAPYLMSHGIAFAAAAAFFHYALKDIRPWRAALAGGIMVLVRWQTATFLPVILIPPVFAWLHARASGADTWPSLRNCIRVAATTACMVVLLFLPQLLAWQSIYGQLVILPQGNSFLSPLDPKLWRILFDREHGLFLWHPLYAAGAIGFLLAARKHPIASLAFLLAFTTQWYLNSIVLDWGAGWSFGNRRFIELLPLVAPGIAHLVRTAGSSKTAVAAASVLTGVLIWMNLTLLYQWRHGLMPRAAAPTWQELLLDRFRLTKMRRARGAALDALGAQIFFDDRKRFRLQLQRAEELNPADRLLPALRDHRAKLDANGPEEQVQQAREQLRREAEIILAQ